MQQTIPKIVQKPKKNSMIDLKKSVKLLEITKDFIFLVIRLVKDPKRSILTVKCKVIFAPLQVYWLWLRGDCP